MTRTFREYNLCQQSQVLKIQCHTKRRYDNDKDLEVCFLVTSIKLADSVMLISNAHLFSMHSVSMMNATFWKYPDIFYMLILGWRGYAFWPMIVRREGSHESMILFISVALSNFYNFEILYIFHITTLPDH